MQLDPCCTIQIAQTAAQQIISMSEEEMESDLSLNAFFGSVYVIHLAEAAERLKCLLDNFHQIGLKDFVLFPACDGRRELSPETYGKMYSLWAARDFKTIEGILAFENQQKSEAGCFMSHFRVIKEVSAKFEEALQSYELAKTKGDREVIENCSREVKRYSSVLILEDDNAFGFLADDHQISLKGCGTLLRLALVEMPQEWDMLYFMAESQFRSQFIGKFLRRIYGTKGANAYAVHYPLYPRLIDHLGAIDDPRTQVIYPFDHQISQLHPDFRCLAITPSIAYQIPGYSTIHSKIIPTARQKKGDL